MADFLQTLTSKKILIADGATGTLLQKAGLPSGSAPERWNIENPEAIKRHYQSYKNAGSDIILTNTFGGTRLRLKRDSIENQTTFINLRAAELAREIAGSKVFVFGDIGPTGELIQPLGTLSEEDATNAYKEQASALAKGGVDAILIETMSDRSEARAALKGARAATNLPIILSFSFDTHGRTMMGLTPKQAIQEFWGQGLTAIGANCGRTLSETLHAIREMSETIPEAVLFAKPNAGLPHTSGGETVYDVTPEVMGTYAEKFAKVGVKIFGGCCGSTPDHIREVVKVLTKSK
jgi:5-methyltetrahydrofolate--homocysteine methyltransferase